MELAGPSVCVFRPCRAEVSGTHKAVCRLPQCNSSVDEGGAEGTMMMKITIMMTTTGEQRSLNPPSECFSLSLFHVRIGRGTHSYAEELLCGLSGSDGGGGGCSESTGKKVWSFR